MSDYGKTIVSGIEMFTKKWLQYASKESYLSELTNHVHNRIGPDPKPFGSSGLLVVDAPFVFRGDPAFKHHDRLGYKNHALAHSADILCLGNSHVHDTSHPVDKNWTWLLQAETGKTVYNGSIGGSNIIQSLLALDELLYLEPEIVILGLYAGTSFYNGVLSVDGVFEKREQEIEEHYMEFYEQFKCFHENHWRRMSSKEDLSLWRRVISTGAVGKDVLQRFVDCFLSKGKEIALHANIVTEDMIEFNNFCMIDEKLFQLHLPARTVLQDTYYKAVSQTREIIEICLRIFKEKSLEFKFVPIVVLFPTKEYVLHSFSENRKNFIVLNKDQFDRHAEIEAGTFNFIRTVCFNEALNYTDPVLALTKFYEEEPTFSMNGIDGHPNDVGKKVIAQKMADYLKTL